MIILPRQFLINAADNCELYGNVTINFILALIIYNITTTEDGNHVNIFHHIGNKTTSTTYNP